MAMTMATHTPPSLQDHNPHEAPHDAGSGVRTIRNKTQIWGRMVIDVVQTTWHRHVG